MVATKSLEFFIVGLISPPGNEGVALLWVTERLRFDIELTCKGTAIVRQWCNDKLIEEWNSEDTSK
jgi:hypothetical protein